MAVNQPRLILHISIQSWVYLRARIPSELLSSPSLEKSDILRITESVRVL